MDPLRASEYEARGLQSLREELAPRAESLAADGRVIRAVGLRGWPPHTELFVEFEDHGKPRTSSWPIWEPDFGPPTDDFEGDPETMVNVALAALLDPFL